VRNEASKTFYFLNFISEIFKGVKADYAESIIPELEKYVRRKKGTVVVESGRIDVLLGNLIIEFESDLSSKLEEAKEQLREYVAILWSEQKHRIQWISLASDGINFHVYRPRTSIALGNQVVANDIVLEELDRCNLESMNTKQGSEWVYVWLDRYFLYRTLVPPTTEQFAEDFGIESKAFTISSGILQNAWNRIKETGAKTIYIEWAKYLEIVYGGKIESEDLFIRHTYLATLAKLMAFMFYSGSALPSLEEVKKIVSGDIFREWGIYGFLEEDFFSWILREGIKEEGMRYIKDLVGRLKRYDLTKLEEDVLKGLYQELVDPKERHDLGEYYTPDWLAESIVENIETIFSGSVLDPACGSGTFLVAAINEKRRNLKDKESPESILDHILSNVVGIDVHPLAVIISKVNYLLALGNLVRDHRLGRITIPVYMGDSIRLPSEVETLEEGVKVYVVKSPIPNQRFLIPKIVAENAEAHDEVVQLVREYVKISGKSAVDTFGNFMMRSEKFSNIIKANPKLQKSLINALFETEKTMEKLEDEKRNTVWAFILKNLFKPLFFFLREKKFDAIIGNPPWLSYRYVKSVEYQEELKKLIVERYKLLPSHKAQLMTHMELATLFLLRVSDLYLKGNGQIGFVMPRSVFPADQHDNFRQGTFVHPDLGFLQVFDMLDVEPLFSVPCCVFFVRKGQKVKYPVSATVFSGKLPRKNCKLDEANQYLNRRNTSLTLGKIGERTFLTEKAFEIPERRSYYFNRIYQGATIVPRQFWLIDFVPHPTFGIDLRIPKIQSSKRAIERAQEGYEDLSLEGVIESQFLFATLTGSEIVPFGLLPPIPAILPIESKQSRYRLISAEEAHTRGLFHLEKWLQKAEAEWAERQGEKAGKMTIYARLDRQSGLSKQNPRAKYRVLYNTSGTYLVSSVLKNRKVIVIIDGRKIKLNGIIIDHKLYYYETDSEDEAFFLSAVLNSKIVDETIKPAQSRGKFGPRDIHKKPFEIMIPKFEPKNKIHVLLSDLAKKCTAQTKKQLPDLYRSYTGIGYIRKRINETLKPDLDRIDDLVLKLFSESGNKETLSAFT
jgi:hypothetical protein